MIVCDTGPLLAAANVDDRVQYGTFPLGAADASVIAVAERLKITTDTALSPAAGPENSDVTGRVNS